MVRSQKKISHMNISRILTLICLLLAGTTFAQGFLRTYTPKFSKAQEVLQTADGGYFMAGVIGHGAAFALRDPNGIRPGFWYEDEDVVALASERAALPWETQTTLHLPRADADPAQQQALQMI
jgi:hypothetical protein